MVCASEGDTPTTQTTHHFKTMFPSFSRKLESKTPEEFSSEIDWEKFQSSSLKPGRRDVLLPLWMEGKIEGTYKSDRIEGTNHKDQIHGHQGSDLIYGHDGNDIIFGDDNVWRGADLGIDTVYGGNGNDAITAEYSYGENGNDTLHSPYTESGYLNGGNGDDKLHGSSAKDTLVGGAGDDHLYGKGHGDVMTGGRGSDHFEIGYLGSIGDLGDQPLERDVITDFQDQGDRISIPAIFHNQLTQDDVSLEFSNRGVLVISIQHESMSGVLAEVYGLDAQQPINDQINWISSSQFELVA